MTNFIARQSFRQGPTGNLKILSLDELEEYARNFIVIEPRFAQVLDQHGLPSLRTTSASLETLLHIVTEQFLSLKAAASIWTRIESNLRPFEPEKIVACGEDHLMSLGLSRAKARSFHGLARAVINRELEFSMLADLPGDEAHKILCGLPGIGPWSAAIFRLVALADADAWPAGDLALQVAAQHLLELPARPNQKQMVEIAEGWRPYRAVAARFLWSHYRGVRGLTQATDSPSQN
jgi:DNA-3-methyladenine glycosylase II